MAAQEGGKRNGFLRGVERSRSVLEAIQLSAAHVIISPCSDAYFTALAMGSNNRNTPWYNNYEVRRSAVAKAKSDFQKRCAELGLNPVQVLLDYNKEIVASAVHESNWQEGVEVPAGRTKELSDVIFADFQAPARPGLDLAAVLESHRKLVLVFKRKGASDEDLATLNLSAAYKAVVFMMIDFLTRFNAILLNLVEKLADAIPEPAPPEIKDSMARVRELRDKTFTNSPLTFPTTHNIKTDSDYLTKAGVFESNDDLNMFEVRHVHFLHRILFTGIFPVARCGTFRRCFVNVGRYDLFLPPPDAVPALMAEFSKNYPISAAFGRAKDEIMEAAKFSHRFVAIHPYNDGNGRISRVLMNLVLCAHHPFVALKATTQKSRRRYYYSLRRADRGDFKPLACLIAISLEEVYAKVMSTFGLPKQNEAASKHARSRGLPS